MWFVRGIMHKGEGSDDGAGPRLPPTAKKHVLVAREAGTGHSEIRLESLEEI